MRGRGSAVTEDRDPARTFSPEEEKQLTEQLLALTKSIQRGELRHRPASVLLLQDMHDALFANVRDHAGRLRAPGFGQEYVTFGPNRSVHRNNVRRELERVSLTLREPLPSSIPITRTSRAQRFTSR